MLKRIIIPVLFTVMLILAFLSCNGPVESNSDIQSFSPSLSPSASPSPTATQKPTSTPRPIPSATPSPTPYTGPVNPLTGLPSNGDISTLRPVAIMLNNIREALPQHGVSAADIIYETLAEGGITRMLGVFQDVTGAGNIGSVRSARAYYIDLAMGHDAIFVHAGGSPQAYNEIYSRGITTVDGVAGYNELFYRDSYRVQYVAYEHSLFTSDELLNEYLPTYSIRREHEDGYNYSITFADNGTPSRGLTATNIDVYFSDYKTGTFEYDESSGLYLVREYGSPYIDGNTEEQVGVTNVLVLFTYISSVFGDEAGRIDVDLVGSGEGFFACGGKYVPITWSKDSYSSQFIYNLDDGSELVFGRGTSYICIIPKNNSVDFS